MIEHVLRNQETKNQKKVQRTESEEEFSEFLDDFRQKMNLNFEADPETES